ncbi:thiamine diphosphokinase [Paenibacillus crassostreae]|uniref:Thiamine diphosphokinase n=1 Tax=Paenibacillus crassostreae TaxID=1763538 RepID=A0A162KVT1_9BACL|nr:thiamine diphosphokinase [Paenibacillus crassostreae]AOZ91097.1 thiamine diphosphokinase [Paenibacillus crassostreae]OAB74743.1 thiamine pyrophosphokinase [Paenibacillus crassostreae]
MKQKRVIIFSGGHLHPEFLNEIQADDFIIGADKGALFLIHNNVHPHLSVGDFDSITAEEQQLVTASSGSTLACDAFDKNLTDTELAFELALEQHPTHILLVGATGTRIDHTLANIHLLSKALEHQIPFAILDNHNYITMTDSTLMVTNQGYDYISLLPMTPEVTGITLEGFVYPLYNATLTIGQSLGISNRLSTSTGHISVRSGSLLVIQSKD